MKPNSHIQICGLNLYFILANVELEIFVVELQEEKKSPKSIFHAFTQFRLWFVQFVFMKTFRFPKKKKSLTLFNTIILWSASRSRFSTKNIIKLSHISRSINISIAINHRISLILSMIEIRFLCVFILFALKVALPRIYDVDYLQFVAAYKINTHSTHKMWAIWQVKALAEHISLLLVQRNCK